jgi:hypothetical protein
MMIQHLLNIQPDRSTEFYCFEHDKARYIAAWDPELWIHALKTAIPIEGAEYCGYKDSGRKHWFIGIVPGEIE